MDFFNQLYQNIIDTRQIEVFAALTGIASTWYSKRENILVYPTGIVSVLLYVYICFNVQLYADAGINGYYFFISVFGWYNWTHKDGISARLPISMNTKKQQYIYILMTGISFFIVLGLLWVFNRYNFSYITSYVPYIDALTTAFFIVGMILMALKRVENWVYWIIGDLISIPLYISKGLVLTSVQYLVFLIIAVYGYKEWKRKWQTESLTVLQ